MLASFTKPMKFACHSGLRCVALLEFGEEAFDAPALLMDDSRSFFSALVVAALAFSVCRLACRCDG